MLVLCDVATTGVLTAFCHAAESRSPQPLLRDPWAEAVADRLAPLLANSPSALLRRISRGKIRGDLVLHIAMRTRKYDQVARDFMERNPGGCVVNLGCGLDMRFWRIDDGRLHLYDLDLPEMIALKRHLVEENERYHLVEQSVLEPEWRDRLAAEQPGPFLFQAEGLLMYLHPDDVRALVLDLCARFPGSELMFETVNSAWLKPALKWMINVKMQRELGLGKGTEYFFGIRDGHEVEEWSPGLRLLEEWSYFDENEPRMGFRAVLGRWDVFRYTQWTVRYALGGEG